MFSQIGFFSAVEYDPWKDPDRVGETGFPTERDHVMVRARVRQDLLNLIDLYTLKFGTSPPRILAWEQRDYPYRIILTKAEWGTLLYSLSMGIDYTNYKDTVKKKQGPVRAHAYMDVWSAMYGLEGKLKPVDRSIPELPWMDDGDEDQGAGGFTMNPPKIGKKKVPARKTRARQGRR